MISAQKLTQDLPCRIQKLAQKLSISLRQLAWLSGYQRSSFVNYVRQTPKHNLSIKRFLYLCNGMGVSPSRMLSPHLLETDELCDWEVLYFYDDSITLYSTVQQQLEEGMNTLYSALLEKQDEVYLPRYTFDIILFCEKELFRKPISLNFVIQSCILCNLSFGEVFGTQFYELPGKDIEEFLRYVEI